MFIRCTQWETLSKTTVYVLSANPNTTDVSGGFSYIDIPNESQADKWILFPYTLGRPRSDGKVLINMDESIPQKV